MKVKGMVNETTSRCWVALVFISPAQLAIALDATIVNIALPSAQRALAIPELIDATRPAASTPQGATA